MATAVVVVGVFARKGSLPLLYGLRRGWVSVKKEYVTEFLKGNLVISYKKEEICN
ncbi:hypothetical protein HanPI659440_Chr14g0556501 [Helianthus annuus]|nr:hypothetical protein HanPI659440_Chr14g0556501 [Helianthus annuus]